MIIVPENYNIMDPGLILNIRRWKYNPIEGITKRGKNVSTKPFDDKFLSL